MSRPAISIARRPHSVGQLLLELQQQEQTMLIVVTHSLELAALFQRRLELDEGRLKEVTRV